MPLTKIPDWVYSVICIRHMTLQEYKTIDGTEGTYGINNNGTIVRLKKGRRTRIGLLLQPAINSRTGYLVASFSPNVKPPSRQIHRLVAIAFIPNPNNLPCVNHKDGNKLNNNVDNLEWCTHKQNTQHAISLGLVTPRRAKPCLWKLSAEDISDIIKQYDEGYSQPYLARKYKVNQCHISRIINKKRRNLCR